MIRWLNRKACDFSMWVDWPYLFCLTGAIEFWLDSGEWNFNKEV